MTDTVTLMHALMEIRSIKETFNDRIDALESRLVNSLPPQESLGRRVPQGAAARKKFYKGSLTRSSHGRKVSRQTKQ